VKGHPKGIRGPTNTLFTTERAIIKGVQNPVQKKESRGIHRREPEKIPEEKGSRCVRE